MGMELFLTKQVYYIVPFPSWYLLVHLQAIYKFLVDRLVRRGFRMEMETVELRRHSRESLYASKFVCLRRRVWFFVLLKVVYKKEAMI